MGSHRHGNQAHAAAPGNRLGPISPGRLASGLTFLWLAGAFGGWYRFYSWNEVPAWILGYTGLSCWMVALSLATAGSRWPRAAVSAAVGLALAWHLRDGLRLIQRPWWGLELPALLLAFWWFRCWRPGRPVSAGSFRGWAAGGAALVVVAGWWIAGSESQRHHLFWHQRLVGLPCYYLFEPSIRAQEEALWARSSGVEPEADGMAEPTRSEALPEARRNVVVLLVDTLRADALGGGPQAESPMPCLSRLAQRGFHFTDVQTNAPWTRPAASSLFTGLAPEEHGAVDMPDRLAARHRTLAEVFTDRGYRTAAFVANYGVVSRRAGLDQGFAEFRELRPRTGPYVRAEGVAGAALAWLGEPALDLDPAPIFLYLHFLDPHEPYLADAGPAGLRSGYEMELRYVDRVVCGALLPSLRAKLGPDTVFLLTSDHGEELGEHRGAGHGRTLYDEVLKVPAVLDLGREARGLITVPLETRDLFSLLVESAGAAELDPAAWAAGHARPVRHASVYFSNLERDWQRPQVERVVMRRVEAEGFVLIWSAYGRTLELYRSSDREQRINLADRHPERVAALRRLLDEGPGRWARREPLDASTTEPDVETQLRALGYVK